MRISHTNNNSNQMILNLLLPFLATLATGLGPLSMHSSSNIAIDDCEIVEFYERIELDRGAKIIGAYGGVEEGEAVLVPTEVEVGNYEVSVRRIDQNYYQIDLTHTDLVISNLNFGRNQDRFALLDSSISTNDFCSTIQLNTLIKLDDIAVVDYFFICIDCSKH